MEDVCLVEEAHVAAPVLGADLVQPHRAGPGARGGDGHVMLALTVEWVSLVMSTDLSENARDSFTNKGHGRALSTSQADQCSYISF